MSNHNNESDKWNHPDAADNAQRAEERAERTEVYKSSGETTQGNLESLPDRQMAERNSVYKLAGEEVDEEQLKNLPDRQMAERNSVYKLAGEQRPGSSDDASDTTSNQHGYTPRSGYRNPNDQKADADQEREFQAGERENNMPETVTQNTEPYDGPSKLDALLDANQPDMPGNTSQSSRSTATRGEHSQVNRDISTTSQWQKDADELSVDSNVPNVGSSQSGSGNIPSARNDSRMEAANRYETTAIPADRNTATNMTARGDGDHALRGEHSQVDHKGGTVSDWKNMPSSTYQGVAGISNQNRHDGEMSLDWDGTAASEHSTGSGNTSNGGNTSQQSNLGK